MSALQCQALGAGDAEAERVTAGPTPLASAMRSRVRRRVFSQSGGVREVGPAIRPGEERGSGVWGETGGTAETGQGEKNMVALLPA